MSTAARTATTGRAARARAAVRRLVKGTGASTTRHGLLFRLGLLLALTAFGTLALFTAYQGVHGNSDPLRTRSGPAVLEVETAKNSLTQAQGAAAKVLNPKQAGVPEMSRLKFQSEMSVANQNLAQAASRNATGEGGRQSLQTVAGLVAWYAYWNEQADRQPEGSLLREAFSAYAGRTLTGEETGIIPRLNALQKAQLAVVDRQAEFGWPRWLEWSVALVLLVTLAGVLAETQYFLYRRFHRRLNLGLAGASVLLLAISVAAVVGTVQTHHSLEGARHALDLHKGDSRADAGKTLKDRMRGTHGRAEAAGWILAGGGLVTVMTWPGLQFHINEYRFQPR